MKTSIFNENQGMEKKLFHTPSCSVLKTEETKPQTVCCVAKRLVPEEAVLPAVSARRLLSPR